MYDIRLRALAELELRKRRQQSRKALSFDEWLPIVSPTYCWNWSHLEYIRRHGLDGVVNGFIKRLALFVPPRHGKSEMVTVRFLAWFLEQDPTQRIILGAYNQTLAEKFSRKVRRIAKERVKLNTERKAVSDWETEAGGGLRAVGVGGGITGMGGNCFPAGTSITTDNGHIDIKHLCSLEYKPKVLAFNHETGMAEFRRIEAARVIKSSDIIEITTRSGNKIRSTSDHKFYVQGSGYKKASSLQVGEKLSRIKKQVCKMQFSSLEKKQRMQNLLSVSKTQKEIIFLLLLQKIFFSSQIRNRQSKEKEFQRLLLFFRMFAKTSCDKKCEEMQALRYIYAREARKQILLKRLLNSIKTTEYDELSFVWKRYRSLIQQNIFLFSKMLECCSFVEDDGKKQSSFQGWNKLFKMVFRNEAINIFKRFILLCCMSMLGKKTRSDLEKKENRKIKFCNTSYRRGSSEQFSRKYDSSLPSLPYKTPQIEADEVAMVKRLRCGIVDVYDIQVEGCRNFFANDLLVHNCIIIDDPVKSREEANSETYRNKTYDWYTDDLYTRLEPNASIILIMTRWHEDDLAGRILASDQADKWTVINLPAFAEENDPLGRQPGQALCPERYDEEQLKIIQDQLKESFLSLYQQRPSAVEGEIFKRYWWRRYNILPYFEKIIHSWDTAFKKGAYNDYSVCTVWGVAKDGYYLLNRWKEKVEFPELKRVVATIAEQYPPDQVLIEDKASGQSLLQELDRETRLPIKAIKVDVDKIARANAATPLIEAGKVFLPENAPWVQDFLDTMSSFPNAPHDDDVDSTTQFLLNEKDKAKQLSFLTI